MPSTPTTSRAIDNTTRKLMSDGQRPLSVGFFFSLGHSTVVFALAAALRDRRPRAERRRCRTTARRCTQATGLDRHRRLRRLPLRDRGPQPGRPRRHRARSSARMRQRRVQRGRARGAARSRGLMNRFSGARRALIQAVADVPAGRALRPGLRHGDRGRAARPGRGRGRRGGLPWYAILCLPILFAAGHVAARHDRRRVHELRLRLGVLQAGAQGLLQHHHHRPVGGRGARHRHRSSCSSIARRQARASPAASGTSSPASTSTSSATSIVGLFVATWALALVGVALRPHRGALGPAASLRVSAR